MLYLSEWRQVKCISSFIVSKNRLFSQKSTNCISNTNNNNKVRSSCKFGGIFWTSSSLIGSGTNKIFVWWPFSILVMKDSLLMKIQARPAYEKCHNTKNRINQNRFFVIFNISLFFILEGITSELLACEFWAQLDFPAFYN